MTPSQNPNLHPLKNIVPADGSDAENLSEIPSGIPSGMDNDPNADEEIIDQTGPQTSDQETTLEPNANGIGRIPSEQSQDPTSDDNLTEKIAYALNGAEPKRS
ncbi:hypothetical protein ACO2Q8_00055 [Larkinella sp. VNQ87]|uniref:hypothetical protein n=1 Tax=Larkinella sp. VNQ87 TaxID=3400921 RepID=UPI003C070119